MTASKQAKAAGLRNVRQMAGLIGRPERTLYDWYNNDPKLFDIAILGCLAKVKQNYECDAYLSPERLDEVKYQIESEIEGLTPSFTCQTSKYESGEIAGLKKALEIIEEHQQESCNGD